MQNIWIKICGITRQQDALSAAELGANAIGVVLYAASSRAVRIDQLADIVRGIPAATRVVALFVDASRAEVEAVVDTGLIDLLQFHGSETAEFCESFSIPYMKAFAVRPGRDLKQLIASYQSAEFILLDSYDPNSPGGTGKAFDWALAQSLARDLNVKLVLAGGLNPGNIKSAIEAVQPFGVDVSSGVEASKGIKDLTKMKLFIEGARASG